MAKLGLLFVPYCLNMASTQLRHLFPVRVADRPSLRTL